MPPPQYPPGPYRVGPPFELTGTDWPNVTPGKPPEFRIAVAGRAGGDPNRLLAVTRLTAAAPELARLLGQLIPIVMGTAADMYRSEFPSIREDAKDVDRLSAAAADLLRRIGPPATHYDPVDLGRPPGGRVIVEVWNGAVIFVDCPPGVEVEVRDYDEPEAGRKTDDPPRAGGGEDADGNQYTRVLWRHGQPEPTREESK